MNIKNSNGIEMVLNNQFNIIEKTEYYTLIFNVENKMYIFLSPINKEGTKYKINIKCKNVKKLKNGNYIIKIKNKDNIYNPYEDYIIGDYHDVIHEFEIYKNNYVLCNVDYIRYGGKYASIESVTNYEGEYLGNCYNKFTNEYYNPKEEHIYNLVRNYKTKLKTLAKKQ